MHASTAPTRISIKKILLATDFSSCSARALSCAARFARVFGAHLHLLHVLPPSELPFVPPGLLKVNGAVLDSPTNPERRVDALEGLHLVSSSSGFADLALDFHVEEGDVCQSVLGEIRRDDIDLVVLGTHGRTGSQKFLFGSVAQAIFEQAQCPVLIVGPACFEGHLDRGGFKNILFPSTYLPHDDEALAFARSLTEESQGHLIVLHVDEHGSSKPCRTSRIHQDEAWDADVRCESITDSGRPAEVVVHYAQECNVDLIVMNVHGTGLMTKVATHLLEGTAYKVACTAPCPVLTIKD